MSDLTDPNRHEYTYPEERVRLEPGTYIDSHWGHYQSQRLVELACEWGWEDEDPFQTSMLLTHYPDLDELEGTIDDPHAVWDELVQEAEDWINDNCLHHLAKTHYFGHHPDIGDIGVWEIRSRVTLNESKP